MVKFTIGSFLNVQVSGIKYIQKLSWACPAPFLPWVLNMEVRPLETSCSLKARGRVPIGSVSQILGRCLSVFIPCSLSTFFLCAFFSSSSYFSFYSLIFPLRSWGGVSAAPGPIIPPSLNSSVRLHPWIGKALDMQAAVLCERRTIPGCFLVGDICPWTAFLILSLCLS